jgi:hypothetical protein
MKGILSYPADISRTMGPEMTNCYRSVTAPPWQSRGMGSRIRFTPLAALILGLAACGASSTSGGGVSAPGTPAGQESSKSPSEIVDDATNVLEAVDSYTVSFTGTDQLGPFSFTINVDTRSNATGTMTQNGQTSQVVYDGTNLYVQQLGLAQLLWQPALDPSFNGRWIVMPSDATPVVDTFRTPSLVAQCAESFTNTAQPGNQTKVNGVPAIPLIANDDSGDKNIITVALDGSAHLLSWEVKAAANTPDSCLGGNSGGFNSPLSWAATSLPLGTFTFSGYQAPVNVVVPSTTANAPAPTETPQATG